MSRSHGTQASFGGRSSRYIEWRAVSVAQLVELLVVVQVVAGSSPVAHPSRRLPLVARDAGPFLPSAQRKGRQNRHTPSLTCHAWPARLPRAEREAARRRARLPVEAAEVALGWGSSPPRSAVRRGRSVAGPLAGVQSSDRLAVGPGVAPRPQLTARLGGPLRLRRPAATSCTRPRALAERATPPRDLRRGPRLRLATLSEPL